MSIKRVAAFLRGGNWNNTSNAGAFALNLNNSPTNTNNNIGFRCARFSDSLKNGRNCRLCLQNGKCADKPQILFLSWLDILHLAEMLIFQKEKKTSLYPEKAKANLRAKLFFGLVGFWADMLNKLFLLKIYIQLIWKRGNARDTKTRFWISVIIWKETY